MMKIEDLKESIEEAERFLKRARVLREKVKNRKLLFNDPRKKIDWSDTTMTAAIKRASMDLSKALVKLRH